jgi:hypothetical protein
MAELPETEPSDPCITKNLNILSIYIKTWCGGAGMKSHNPWQVWVARTLLAIPSTGAGPEISGNPSGSTGPLAPFLRLAAVILFAALATGPAFAQKDDSGYPEDWTHHHVVISDPGSVQNALISGSYYKWRDVVSDPRFDMQRKKRSTGSKPVGDPGDFVGSDAHGRRGGGPSIEKDWSSAMLSGAVQPSAFPAKWSFSTTTASCANDYVIYPTGAAGSTAAASIIAFNNLYTGGCTTGAVPSVYWAYDTGGAVSTSPVLSFDGTQVAFIQVTGTAASLVVLKGHLNTTGRTVTGVLTVANPEVTISAGTFTQADVGAQISGTGIPAGDTIASVLSATTANLATAPTAHASETLTITAEAAATPGVAPTVTNANYRACAAPCMTTLVLSGSHNDTFSSPFYLYGNDTLYVGDDSGNLHKFSGIFNGTPAEVTTSWPVVLNAANKVTSPVYDFGTGYVMVGDTGGIFYGVGSGNSGTTSGSVHGTSSALGGPIIDGALVDPSAGMAYVFVTTNTGANNAVFQFSTNFTSGTGNGAATGTTVGTGGTVAQQYYLYSGTFDNVYYSSAVHTGNLWVMGNTSAAGGGALYRIPITANAMSATSTAAVTVNATRQPWPSPLSEFCANGTSACVSNGTDTTTGIDYVFFSVNHANVGGCTNTSGNGCVLAYNISTPATPAISGTGLKTVNVGRPGCWATSGIIIDNSVVAGTLAGASQIYFINFNGHTAGGPNGNTSVTCTSAVAATIDATQALQSSP